jgi:PIN domain nuclease of toxin-antitoxin system
MKVLLDTNAFIRWTTGSTVPRAVHRVLGKPSTEIYLSVVSAWEIAIKPKLRLSHELVEASIERVGALLVPIRLEHLAELSRLPVDERHRDPFDRLLIAQALSEDLTMVSADRDFGRYKRLQLLWD